MDEIAPTKLVTVDYFMMEMLGFKNRASYYNHLDDEGWPQRVYPGGDKPMLVLAECEAYIALLKAKREREPYRKAKAGQGTREGLPVRRHPGRPAKVHGGA